MTSFDRLCNIFPRKWNAIDFLWPQRTCIKYPLKKSLSNTIESYGIFSYFFIKKIFAYPYKTDNEPSTSSWNSL